MKIIKIEVECCEYCLYYDSYTKDEKDIDYCQIFKGKTIFDTNKIPKWCPLEDLE